MQEIKYNGSFVPESKEEQTVSHAIGYGLLVLFLKLVSTAVGLAASIFILLALVGAEPLGWGIFAVIATLPFWIATWFLEISLYKLQPKGQQKPSFNRHFFLKAFTRMMAILSTSSFLGGVIFSIVAPEAGSKLFSWAFLFIAITLFLMWIERKSRVFLGAAIILTILGLLFIL